MDKTGFKTTIYEIRPSSVQICDVLVIKDQICFLVIERYRSAPALWRYNVDLNSMTRFFGWVDKLAFCAVVVDKLIYVLGGIMLKDTHPLSNSPLYGRGSLSHCSTFDSERNEWKEIAPLKEARMDAFGVNKNEEKIFIAGGLGIRPGWRRSCEVYTIATNEWQFMASLTLPRVCGKMVLIDGTIYVLGGNVQTPLKDTFNFSDGRVPVECYDEEADKWNDRTTMPFAMFIDRENPRAIYRARLNICSVRLFNPFSSEEKPGK